MDTISQPKRRNAEKTKATILEAAQQQFAECGYSQTGFRDIAQSAGVAPSLLVRHFGSKPELFEAALLAAMSNQDILEGDRATLGKRLSKTILKDADIKLPSMIVLSAGDPDARAISSAIMQEHVISGLAEWLGPPSARERAMNLTMLLSGFTLYARQIPSGAVGKHTLDWLARSIQAIVDER